MLIIGDACITDVGDMDDDVAIYRQVMMASGDMSGYSFLEFSHCVLIAHVPPRITHFLLISHYSGLFAGEEAFH